MRWASEREQTERPSSSCGFPDRKKQVLSPTALYESHGNHYQSILSWSRSPRACSPPALSTPACSPPAALSGGHVGGTQGAGIGRCPSPGTRAPLPRAAVPLISPGVNSSPLTVAHWGVPPTTPPPAPPLPAPERALPPTARPAVLPCAGPPPLLVPAGRDCGRVEAGMTTVVWRYDDGTAGSDGRNTRRPSARHCRKLRIRNTRRRPDAGLSTGAAAAPSTTATKSAGASHPPDGPPCGASGASPSAGLGTLSPADFAPVAPPCPSPGVAVAAGQLLVAPGATESGAPKRPRADRGTRRGRSRTASRSPRLSTRRCCRPTTVTHESVGSTEATRHTQQNMVSVSLRRIPVT